jgi:hypothetical protein
VKRSVRAQLPAAGASLSFGVALVVIIFGVIATSGVYGSRMAWLLGVALPLLATTAWLSWLAFRLPTRRALAFLGLPAAFAALLLSAYALIFAVHGISLLH